MQAVAQPGSGKTLGYLLPGVEQLREAGHGPSSRPAGPLMLVLTPTRHASFIRRTGLDVGPCWPANEVSRSKWADGHLSISSSPRS